MAGTEVVICSGETMHAVWWLLLAALVALVYYIYDVTVTQPKRMIKFFEKQGIKSWCAESELAMSAQLL